MPPRASAGASGRQYERGAMIGKFTVAMLGRTIARRTGRSGLLGTVMGIGASILLRRLAPLIERATVREGGGLLKRRRTARTDDDEIQAAGA